MKVVIELDELTEFLHLALGQLFKRGSPSLAAATSFLDTSLLSYFASVQVRNQRQTLQTVTTEILVYCSREQFVDPVGIRAALWDVGSIARSEAEIEAALGLLVEQGVAMQALGNRYWISG